MSEVGSIQKRIDDLKANRQAIIDSIEGQGVVVPDDAKFADLAGLADQISDVAVKNYINEVLLNGTW